MSTYQFNFIRPSKLNNSRIMSWFTTKNKGFRADRSKIDGLNLGFNTNENQEVILENIHRLSSEIGINHRNLALANQIHSDNVLSVSTGGVYPNVDALVTKTPGITLGIQVADCASVLLGDFENKVIGAAHAGWRGAVAEIVPKTILKMIEIGADPVFIRAFVSPCISKDNFEVGEEVASKFPSHLVIREKNSKPHVNLKALIFEQLIESGIITEKIEIDDNCTIDESDQFYSYRREKEMSGRMLGLIKLNKF